MHHTQRPALCTTRWARQSASTETCQRPNITGMCSNYILGRCWKQWSSSDTQSKLTSVEHAEQTPTCNTRINALLSCARLPPSTKRKVYNLLKRRTEPQPQATCRNNLVNVECVVSEICSWTDTETGRQTDGRTCSSQYLAPYYDNNKHLKNFGPIRHREPPHAHSPDVASGTVVRRLRIDVHDIDNDDNDDNDNDNDNA